MELPEKCCAFCLHWKPNRIPDFHAGDEKTCWKHNRETQDEFYCQDFVGSDSTEANVPNHTPNGVSIERNKLLPEVKCHGLIVTYATPTMRVSGKVVSELDWLEYSLRSYFKWCSGFSGLTIAHPRHESALFKSIADRFDVRLVPYNETVGKGFVQHQAMMAMADTFLPADTTHVLHWDADCIWKMETTPMDYFYQDKPIYIWRPYESLIEQDPRNPNAKVVSDCYQWKEGTERQLGFPISEFTMTRHPSVYPLRFYRKYRDHIEKVQHKSFMQFHLDSKNDHPSGSLDFTAYGGYCFREMHSDFHWFDCTDKTEYPIDRMVAYWSHGGTDEAICLQMERLISGESAGATILTG